MRHILALDVGTTTVRCHVLNESVETLSTATKKLWNTILRVLKTAVQESKVDVYSIASVGISTQRGSFICWNYETGKNYHKFITWKDLRADSLVKEWNSSLTMKSLRMGSHILYTFSRNKRFLAGSVFKLMNTQMTLRLMWALDHVPGLKEAAENGKAVFGGIDSWILYKLTGKHISDVSSASATGLFDPFTMSWANWAINLFKIPSTMFPEVIDSAGNFGNIPKEIFGVEIPITCCMADQAASLFGSGCFDVGDLKITMGTGTFLNVNTGSEPHASVAGLYPLVAWKIGSELVYMAEGASNDTGSIIEWAKCSGMIKNPEETVYLAESVRDSDGVFFIPAFSGLQAPINDQTATAGFLGLKPTSTKAHMVRAILESLVFRIVLLYETLRSEIRQNYTTIRVDGGVSQNDFVLQLLADLTGLLVERAVSSEMSILGITILSGLQSGIWNDKKELYNLRQIKTIFKPNETRKNEYQSVINQWKRAVERFKNWY
ncbi:putative glycerol kinase 5 isoform X2 [Chelonus insularis]|uniref:putative glycerol kinase 5 isoform X2 n=1 Tax=Chelonus insularis TaxID=460826 RepID=UPI00158EFB82|nr:putative glycerol kinase 5 isoform X2 [Chelonus insularis]